MLNFLHRHLHHGHPDEFTQILRSRNIRAFGLSLASIFIVLYLVTIYGGLIPALGAITAYVVATYSIKFIAMPLLARAVVSWGPKHAMAASFAVAAIGLVMVTYIQQTLWWIVVFGVLIGINNALYYLAYHIDLANTLNRDDSVKQSVGLIEMVRKVAIALGPLVGGVIATRVSEQLLFLIAAGVISVAAAALYLDDDASVLPKTDVLVYDFDFLRKNTKDFLASFSMGVNTTASSTLWSILLFVTIGSYEAVGFVVALSLVLSLIVIGFIRRNSSLAADKKEITSGASSSAVIHVLRPFVETTATATGLNLFSDIADAFVRTPYVDRYYKHANNPDGMSYITGMEMAVSVGHVLAWLLFAALLVSVGQTWAFIGAFVVAAAVTPLISLISR